MTDDPTDPPVTDELTPFDADDMLAAELVMGLLDEDEAASARIRARQDTQFGTAVALWQERLVVMADDVAPVKPPRRIRKTLQQRLFKTQKVPLGKRVWVWQTLTYASLAVAMYMAVQMWAAPPQIPNYATQMQSDETEVQVLALYDPGKGVVSLNRVSGRAATGRDLELWVIEPGADPVSLGVLPRDEELTVVPVPAVYAAQAGRLTFALSDEPLGGSPTGQATGPIVAVGAMSQI